jgi:methionine aminopeptidase
MVTLPDGWTLRTRDRSRSAHHEQTLVVTAEGARLLTA